jgi:CRISPR-associated protein Csb2
MNRPHRPNMLAVTVEFLNGRYYARDTSDEKLPEWPPHPARMFAALVAAAAETRELERFRPLLISIESFHPPDIAAVGSPWPRIAWNSGNRLSLNTSASEVFVRINDPESKSGSQAHPIPALRTLQKRYLPSVRVPNTDGESSVHYVWPKNDLSSDMRSEMEELCGRVGYLGSSRSKVRIFLASNHPSATWKYAADGKEFLRVPRQGTLAELEASFNVTWGLEAEGNRSYPPAGSDAGYMRVTPEGVAVVEPRASNFSSLFLFQLRGPRLHLESTLFLTQKFRGALLQAGDGHPLAAIHGHQREDHLAVVPLAFVGAPHADGEIKGIGALIPDSLPMGERDRLLYRLAGIASFSDSFLGDWALSEVDIRLRPIEALRKERWTAGSRFWATVTPYFFDRYPKSNAHPADIIAGSCERIGIGKPTRISISQHSALAGVPRSREFSGRRPGKPTPKPSAHLTLAFSHEVRGPVVIGEKRYFGLGLCTPTEREMIPGDATVYEFE